MAVSVERFVGCLADSGLLSSDDLLAIRNVVSPEQRQADAHDFARDLVRQGRLTLYQASLLYLGKSKGLVFGEYVVLDKLGQGGMGLVLKAQHRRMKRVVALKVLSPAVTRSAHTVKRFQREVEAAARLSHPNIVTAFDAGLHEGMHYLVMEYVNGRDLSAIVKAEGPLAPEQALDYLLQAARGLEHAHQLGIIHRDIKPGNLLLDIHGQIKILDMGLARLDYLGQQYSAEENITRTGTIMGTVDYMAPEQAVNTRHADHRADIYSLGCTLYFLLTGAPPYEGETMMERLVAHRERPIPSLRARRAEVSAALDGSFQRMMAKQPADRYPAVEDLIADLEAAQQPGTVPAAAPRLPESAPSSSGDIDLLKFLGSLEPQSVATKRRGQITSSDTLDDSGSDITSIAAVGPETDSVSSERVTATGLRRRLAPPQIVSLAASAVVVAVLLSAGLFRLIAGQAEQGAIVAPPRVAAPPSAEPLISTDEFHQVDQDRTGATWIITQGGKVTIQIEGRGPLDISSVARLPAERFHVVGATLPADRELTNADIGRLRKLPELSMLDLSGIAIQGGALQQLITLKTLKTLNVSGTRLSAASLERLRQGLPDCEIIAAVEHQKAGGAKKKTSAKGK
ncbi:MAG: serine/threonine protein kinase [Planctomycetes bacterium]|nr:serine/threonine protein kinase [Planctomycetota bacterium]